MSTGNTPTLATIPSEEKPWTPSQGRSAAGFLSGAPRTTTPPATTTSNPLEPSPTSSTSTYYVIPQTTGENGPGAQRVLFATPSSSLEPNTSGPTEGQDEKQSKEQAETERFIKMYEAKNGPMLSMEDEKLVKIVSVFRAEQARKKKAQPHEVSEASGSKAPGNERKIKYGFKDFVRKIKF